MLLVIVINMCNLQIYVLDFDMFFLEDKSVNWHLSVIHGSMH